MALRITSWNVNSIRARLDHVLTYLSDHEPDVLCLQETKVEDRLFPRVPFMELGYRVHVHGGRALCGVATMTKVEPEEVQPGFRGGDPDLHPRVLQVKVDGVRIWNLYAPNGTEVGSEAFAYKLAWFHRLRAELEACCSADDQIVLVGDFNVAPEDRDLWDPMRSRGRLLFTDAEHAALQHLLGFGLHDCFRAHVSEGGHFTWYDYRTNGFTRAEGMRIDHVYATSSMLARSVAVEHDSGPRAWESPSDHVPVTATFR